MTRSPFHLRREELPAQLPIFPLPGAILLPRAQLPLNIFEPRYLSMTLDALGSGRLIGMIQPDSSPSRPEAVYAVGCAGRITAFSETEDGRLLIVLTGVCRFRLEEELTRVRGYRRVRPDWAPFVADLGAPDDSVVRRGEILQAARRCAEAKHLDLDLDTLGKLPSEELVNALSMHLPFEPAEKQSLVEAVTLGARADALVALAALLSAGEDAPGGAWH